MHEVEELEIENETSTTRKVARGVKYGALLAIVLVLGFAGGVRVGAAGVPTVIANIPFIGDGLNPTADPNLDFTDFWKVYNILNSKFVQTHGTSTASTSQARVYGAIQGLTASYGDPYTVFFPPEEAKAFNDQIAGNFEGVGMQIGINADNRLTVIAPLKGTPAEAAGIKAGDWILTINGKSTDGVSDDAAVKLIRGPKGTTVTFTISRGGVVQEIKVVRDTIQTPTLDYSFDANTGIYTISLYEFSAKATSLFDAALRDFRASGSKKLIIDLRGNPGGYLDSAVDIASYFLPKGTLVVTEDYKGKSKNIAHKSAGYAGVSPDTKVVVLIDQGSASASEILAGVLRDNNRATLIGTRSFGKGSVQEVINVGDAELKVTVARWLTPSGRSISEGGLTPDVVATTTPQNVAAKKDVQKERAIFFLQNGN